jgi:hypothetical protein
MTSRPEYVSRLYGMNWPPSQSLGNTSVNGYAKSTLVFTFTTLLFVLSNGAFAQSEPAENPDSDATSIQPLFDTNEDEATTPDKAESEVPPKGIEPADQLPESVAPVEEAEFGSAHHKIKVEFRTNQPGLAFHRAEEKKIETGRRSKTTWEFRRLCAAPCATEIEPGEYQLAISSETREPILIVKSIELIDHTVIEGVYRSYTPERMAGWLILGIGAIGGIGAGLAGVGFLTNDGDSDDSIGGWMLGGSLGAALLSAIVGGVMASKDDKAKAFVMPRTVSYP